MRVRAVFEVLAGDAVEAVAERAHVDPDLLRRWVDAFVDAGAAAVVNRPAPDAARRRDRFLATFAHEVHTPLSLARGWADLIAGGSLDEAAMRDAAARLQQSLARLADRTHAVELMARASLGRLQLRHEEVALRDVVSRIGDVPVSAVEGPQRVLQGDPELLGVVLRDLWVAANGAPVPDQVTIRARDQGPWTEVRVQRRGPEVPPRVLQALFDPFESNDEATGVTLGLYVTRALAVAHGGQVGVDQDASGTVFWLRLPAVGAPAGRGDER